MASNVRISGSQSSPCSESDIRINYNNLNQIICGSNRIGPSTQGQYFSNDGGATWSQSNLPSVSGDSFQSDPGVDWTSDGTAWAVTVGAGSSNVVRAFKSTEAGNHWTFDQVVSGSQDNVDKPMLWVDRSAASPHKDNIYVLWWNNGPTFVARRDAASGTWQTPLQVSGTETSGGSDGGDIKTNAYGDVFAFWPSEGTRKLFVAKSTDGGATFTALGTSPVQIASTFASFLYDVPADASRGVLLYITGGAYRTATEDIVYALWMDLAGGTGCNSSADEPGTNVSSTCKTRIWFSRSTDGGAHWSAPVKINDQSSLNDQFFPRLAVDPTTGALMVIYYDTVGDSGRKKSDVWMQFSTDRGVNWSGAMKVTTAETDETASSADSGNQYGDYISLTGHASRFFACWTDRRNGGNEEIWGAPLAIPACQLIINKSTFGQDEVSVSATYAPALWLAVDGFFHEALGFNSTSNLGNTPNPQPSISLSIDPSLNTSLTVAQIATIAANLPSIGFGPLPVVAEDPSLQVALQRFLYPYTITFLNQNAFNALSAHQVAVVTVKATFSVGSVTVTASAAIELAKGEDPYFRNVDTSNPTQPSWLSFDLRFFKVTDGQTHQTFGATLPSSVDDVPRYIGDVLTNLNTPGANLNGDSFDGLAQDEDQSALEFHQRDDSNNLVYNFALARVRLVGNTAITIDPVRVFFRLFQAQSTASDFNENTTYRFASDGALNGHKIALLGVQNDANGNPEYVTIPCFASPRINLGAPADMKTQTDPPNARAITIVPGTEVDTYFGCWLDVNQPQQQFLIPTPPANSSQWDGPWTGMQSINGVISVAPHQCLIAEIRFDDTPIPPGATSANSDKLAQRNIAWLHAHNPGVDESRRTPHPVEIRATPTYADEVDELLITWGSTPAGSKASLYLPGVMAADIIGLATRAYASHRLTALDQHTIECPAEGATYLPIPRGTARNAGLLTVELPAGVRRGHTYNIVVRQLTEAVAWPRQQPPPPRITAAVSKGDGRERITWRRLLGAFQFTIKVDAKGELLFPEERLLAWLKWRVEVTPGISRWRPVLQRYLEQIVGRVHGLGGDPGAILPSPGGVVDHGKPRPGKDFEDHRGYTGKVSGVIYDRFGDFEGFTLLTEEGHEKHFRGREHEIEELVREAWRDRFLITVLVDDDEPERPIAVVLRRAPRYHDVE